MAGCLPRDSDGDEDPYSTILFSDISPLLFPCPPLSSTALETTHITLLLVFIQFLGLSVPGLSESLVSGGDSSVDTTWSYTSLLRKPSLISSLYEFSPSRDSKPAITAPLSTEELVTGKERRMGSGWGPIKHWSMGVLEPLVGHGLRGEGRMWEEHDLEGVDVDFARCVILLSLSNEGRETSS